MFDGLDVPDDTGGLSSDGSGCMWQFFFLVICIVLYVMFVD